MKLDEAAAIRKAEFDQLCKDAVRDSGPYDVIAEPPAPSKEVMYEVQLSEMVTTARAAYEIACNEFDAAETRREDANEYLSAVLRAHVAISALNQRAGR